ncbi:MAG: nodulation S family protein [Burkholderiaceae bacterium]|jgi:2-polyprenyl-3-methyl-5-hydroxy-6-metoxy-1,4-benzoquinol methylase|nr:nodulation S family protein [Burkholderiaceae bacterium]
MIDRTQADADARRFFDKLWSKGDPWDLETHPFERAKYDAQLALLDADRGPGRRYGRALEIGCAAGAFSRRLAERCERVVALDIAGPAIELARSRTTATNVEYVQANAMEWKEGLAGDWDLVVCAETMCYLGWLYPFFDVAYFAHCVFEGTRPGGRLLLANTCGGVEDWLLRPWVIRTYHDLFRNAGFAVVEDTVFSGDKNGASIEAMITLCERPA